MVGGIGGGGYSYKPENFSSGNENRQAYDNAIANLEGLSDIYTVDALLKINGTLISLQTIPNKSQGLIDAINNLKDTVYQLKLQIHSRKDWMQKARDSLQKAIECLKKA